MQKYAQNFVEQLVDEHNRIRRNPKSYIPILQEYKATFKGKISKFFGSKLNKQTIEGTKPVDEAIEFLKEQPPVSELFFDEILSQASQKHAEYLCQEDTTGHRGNNGTSPLIRVKEFLKPEGRILENIDFGDHSPIDIIICFIVDDGVSNRGHRKALFTDDLRYIGVGIGKHPTFQTCIVIDYVQKIVSYHGTDKPVPHAIIEVIRNKYLENNDEDSDEELPKKTVVRSKKKKVSFKLNEKDKEEDEILPPESNPEEEVVEPKVARKMVISLPGAKNEEEEVEVIREVGQKNFIQRLIENGRREKRLQENKREDIQDVYEDYINAKEKFGEKDENEEVEKKVTKPRMVIVNTAGRKNRPKPKKEVEERNPYLIIPVRAKVKKDEEKTNKETKKEKQEEEEEEKPPKKEETKKTRMVIVNTAGRKNRQKPKEVEEKNPYLDDDDDDDDIIPVRGTKKKEKEEVKKDEEEEEEEPPKKEETKKTRMVIVNTAGRKNRQKQKKEVEEKNPYLDDDDDDDYIQPVKKTEKKKKEGDEVEKEIVTIKKTIIKGEKETVVEEEIESSKNNKKKVIKKVEVYDEDKNPYLDDEEDDELDDYMKKVNDAYKKKK